MRPYLDPRQVRSWANAHSREACTLWRQSAKWRRWLASQGGDSSLAREMPGRCAAERGRAIQAVAGAAAPRVKSLVDHATSASPTRRAQGRAVLRRVQTSARQGDPRARLICTQVRAICVSRSAHAAVGGWWSTAASDPKRGRWSLRNLYAQGAAPSRAA